MINLIKFRYFNIIFEIRKLVNYFLWFFDSVFYFFRYVCSKTKKEIEASRSLYLDELPSVLILHLKRFIYDETSSGGCQKLLKNIDFPVDLEIPKDILSNSSKNKYHPKQRSYKLFAVVSTFLKLTIFVHILICWICNVYFIQFLSCHYFTFFPIFSIFDCMPFFQSCPFFFDYFPFYLHFYPPWSPSDILRLSWAN